MNQHRKIEYTGHADNRRADRQVGVKGEGEAEDGCHRGEQRGDGGALFRGFGEAVGGVRRDDEQRDDQQQAEVLHGRANKEADEEEKDEVVAAARRVFGFGDGGADGHEDKRLPEDAQGKERDGGGDDNGDEVVRFGGENVAKEVGKQVGAHVFHLRHNEVAQGERDMRQAAEDVAWVFPPAALNEVEEQHQEQGDAPDTDGGRQAEPEREGDAEEGGMRQRFAEVDEAAPADERADGRGGGGGGQRAEAGDEDVLVEEHGLMVAGWVLSPAAGERSYSYR